MRIIMKINSRTPTLILWFFRRMLSVAGTRIIASTLAGGLGTAATLGSIWMIVALAVDLQSERNPDTGLTISVRDHILVEGIDFATAIGAIGVVAILAAIFQYLGDLLGLSAAAAAVRRIRAEAAQACSSSAGDRVLRESQAKSIVSFIQIVSRECGMAAVQLVRVPLAALTVIACITLLGFLSPALLVVLSVTAPFYLLAIGLLNRRSHQDHLEHVLTADAVRTELQSVMGETDRRHAMTGVVLDEESLTRVARSDRILFGRIALVRKVTLVNAITTALVIMVMLVSMQADILGLEGDWGRLLVVLFVLRYLAAAIRQASIAFNVTSRFTESINAARRLEDPPPRPLAATDLPEGLVILSKRIDRLQAIRGISTIERVEPIFTEGAIHIDLIRESLDDITEPTIVHQAGLDASAESLGGRPIVVMARSRAEIESICGRGFEPRTAADLRVDPPVIRAWADVSDELNVVHPHEDQTDNTELLDEEV